MSNPYPNHRRRRIIKRAVIIAAVLALVGVWSTGAFDHALVNLHLNAKDCGRNALGAVYCGDELKEARERQERAEREAKRLEREEVAAARREQERYEAEQRRLEAEQRKLDRELKREEECIARAQGIEQLERC